LCRSDNLSEKVKELEVTNAQLKQQLVETVKQLKQPEPRPDLEMLMRLESENIKLKESLQIQRSEAEKAKVDPLVSSDLLHRSSLNSSFIIGVIG